MVSMARQIVLEETDGRYEVYLEQNRHSGAWVARWFDGSNVLVSRYYEGYDLDEVDALVNEEAAK